MDFMDMLGIVLASFAFVVGLSLFGPKESTGEDGPE